MKKERSPLGWILQTTGIDKIYVGVLVLLQTLLGGSSVLYALFLRSIIDEAVAGRREGMLHSAFLLIGLALLQILLRAGNRFLQEFCASDMENRFKKRLFSCLLRKDYASVTAVHSGEWMNRLTSDTRVVAKTITTLLPNLVGMVVRLAAALTTIIALEPIFAAVLLPGGLLLMLLTYSFRKVLKALHKRIQEADGKVRIFMQEHLGSLLVVRSFGAEERTEELAGERMTQHRRARMRRSNTGNACAMGLGLIVQCVYVGSAIYCSFGLLHHSISYGTLLAILQLVGQIQSPFAGLSGMVTEYYAMLASAERLMEAETFPDEAGSPRPEEEVRGFYERDFEELGLEEACFTYQPPAGEGDTPMPVVLEKLSLRIRKGEYVAFTGHSGSGKSTVLKLLMSIYPLDSGSRYLLSREGRRELDASWRGLFAYVPQGNHLVSGSIREVIAFGDKEAMQREEALWRALRVACAEDFVSALDKGLDSPLGEGGSGLSEGQMQRIAIARAVFSGRPILLLDEATSSLDGETEKRLLENLRAMTDQTVVIVTHRLAALAICDKRIELAGE